MSQGLSLVERGAEKMAFSELQAALGQWDVPLALEE